MPLPQLTAVDLERWQRRESLERPGSGATHTLYSHTACILPQQEWQNDDCNVLHPSIASHLHMPPTSPTPSTRPPPGQRMMEIRNRVFQPNKLQVGVTLNPDIAAPREICGNGFASPPPFAAFAPAIPSTTPISSTVSPSPVPVTCVAPPVDEMTTREVTRIMHEVANKLRVDESTSSSSSSSDGGSSCANVSSAGSSDYSVHKGSDSGTPSASSGSTQSKRKISNDSVLTAPMSFLAFSHPDASPSFTSLPAAAAPSTPSLAHLHVSSLPVSAALHVENSALSCSSSSSSSSSPSKQARVNGQRSVKRAGSRKSKKQMPPSSSSSSGSDDEDEDESTNGGSSDDNTASTTADINRDENVKRIILEAQTKRRRVKIPLTAVKILQTWFEAHLAYPYPTEEEKRSIMQQANLDDRQFINWFTNTRKRFWYQHPTDRSRNRLLPMRINTPAARQYVEQLEREDKDKDKEKGKEIKVKKEKKVSSNKGSRKKSNQSAGTSSFVAAT